MANSPEIRGMSGKSSQLAGVGVYGLVADDEPGAEIYTAATKKDQARIIFGEAQRMVRMSPELREIVSVFKLNLSVDETARPAVRRQRVCLLRQC